MFFPYIRKILFLPQYICCNDFCGKATDKHKTILYLKGRDYTHHRFALIIGNLLLIMITYFFKQRELHGKYYVVC